MQLFLLLLLMAVSNDCNDDCNDCNDENSSSNNLQASFVRQIKLAPMKLNAPVRVRLTHGRDVYDKVSVDIVNMTGSPPNRFVIFQTHSLYRPLVASLGPTGAYGEQQIGSDASVLRLLRGDEKQVEFYTDSVQNRSVDSLLLAVAGKQRDPIPGACCLTCALEFDPNIVLSYDFLRTTIRFARANVGWSPGQPEPACDDGPAIELSLRYAVYYYFVEEGEFAEDSLFEAVARMSTVEGITKYGHKLGEREHTQPTYASMETASAQGVVFNVIVSDPVYKTRSAYAPAVTYGCNFTSTIDGCFPWDKNTNLAFCIVGAVVGLILCFAGFKLYVCLVFVCGTVEMWFVVYILLTRFSTFLLYRDRMLASALPSLIGGVLLVAIEKCSKYVYVGLLNVTIMFGLLLTSIVFYTPMTQVFGDFSSDTFYILTFFCAVLAVAIIAIFFPKPTIILCSTLGGSYGMIVLCNYILGGNMQHVIINVILRLTIDGYGHSFMARPFQIRDMILSGCWAFVLLVGIIFQCCTTRGKKFNPDGSDLRLMLRNGLSASGSYVRRKLWTRDCDDTNPLLHNYHDDHLGHVEYDTNHHPTYTVSPNRASRKPTASVLPDYSITPSFSESAVAPSFTSFHPRNAATAAATAAYENLGYGATNRTATAPPPPINPEWSSAAALNNSDQPPALSTFKARQRLT